MSKSKVEADPERNQGRYNLRRRKDDGDAKPVETKPVQHEKGTKLAAAPAASLSTSLDFGGKIGRLNNIIIFGGESIIWFSL